MNTRIYETPKAGLDDVLNEDAVHMRTISDSALMVSMSDGASTGVFSKEWSDHIVKSIDSAWLESPEKFEFGLKSIRETFKPDITRPTALRKFLMEGSYATVMSAMIEKTGWMFGRLKLTVHCIGDISLFVFNPEGELEYSFPQKKRDDFNNVPDLFRSNATLQSKSPCTLKSDVVSAPRNSLIAMISDALGEFTFRNHEKKRALPILKDIAACKDNSEFRELMDAYRHNGMKNDDVTVCLLTEKPNLYY